jgi:hypothetical protein
MEGDCAPPAARVQSCSSETARSNKPGLIATMKLSGEDFKRAIQSIKADEAIENEAIQECAY